MKQLLFFILSLSFCSKKLLAQEKACEVKMETIMGVYTGECSGGSANGEGKSVGMDTYEGTFKNGLPNGMGKYTWKNEDYYWGEWKKGMKEGKGEIHKTVDGKETVTKGYWKKDIYKGENLKPYVIHDATTEIGRVEINKIREGNIISIDVQSLSGGQYSTVASGDGSHPGTEEVSKSTNISITEIRIHAGSFDSRSTNMLTQKEVTVLKNVVFPFRATFVLGSNASVDIEIFDEGTWNISIPVQK